MAAGDLQRHLLRSIPSRPTQQHSLQLLLVRDLAQMHVPSVTSALHLIGTVADPAQFLAPRESV